MGFPSLPPSGRVVSLIEVLALMGLGKSFGYVSSQEKQRRRTLVGKNEESLFDVRSN